MTYSGVRLVEAARKILDLKQQIISEINDINEGRRSRRLSIGVSHTRGCSILPDVLPQFMKEHPLVEVSVLEGNSGNRRRFSKGYVDLIIGMAPVMLDYFETIELVKDRLFCCTKEIYTADFW